jgi:hypothetical protein
MASSTGSNGSSNVSNGSTMDLFVVQKCWFSGPHTFPPVDCARLFTSAAEAETMAYQSAHAAAAEHNSNHSTTRVVVRTLQLQQPTSSFGFCAGSSLFWVRLVPAVLVGLPPHLPVAAAVAAATRSGAQALVCTHRHALWTTSHSTEVGGSYYPRRACLPAATVFVGPQAAAVALQALTHLGGTASGARMAWLPVGPPPVASWGKEWPEDTTVLARGDNDIGSTKRSAAPLVLDQYHPNGKQQQQQQQQQQTQLHRTRGPALLSWNTMNQSTLDLPNDTLDLRPTKRGRVLVEPSTEMAWYSE